MNSRASRKQEGSHLLLRNQIPLCGTSLRILKLGDEEKRLLEPDSYRRPKTILASIYCGCCKSLKVRNCLPYAEIRERKRLYTIIQSSIRMVESIRKSLSIKPQSKARLASIEDSNSNMSYFATNVTFELMYKFHI